VCFLAPMVRGAFCTAPKHLTCAQARATFRRSTRRRIFVPWGSCQRSRRATAAAQVGPFDKLSIKGLTTFAPGKPLTVAGTRPDGSSYEFTVNQTFNENQIHWFKAGSALNAMGAANKA